MDCDAAANILEDSILPEPSHPPVHVGRKKTQDALHMHPRVTHVAMAAAARFMYDTNIRADKAFVSGESQTGAKIHVLVVKEVALIEAVHFAEHGGWKEHEHARHPVGRAHPGRVRDCRRLAAEKLAEKLAKRRKAPGAVLTFSRAIANARSDHSDPLSFRQLDKGGKRIIGQPNVGIEHAEEVAFDQPEGGIVIRAEALGTCVAEDTDGKGEMLQ